MGTTRLARGLAAIGAYSYSIYLWHLPVRFWLVAELEQHTGIQNWVFYALVYYGGSIAVGIAFAKLIEYPVLRFRDRVLPTAARAVEPTSTALHIAERVTAESS